MSSRMSFKNHTKVLPTSMLDLNNRLKVCDSVTHLFTKYLSFCHYDLSVRYVL